MRLSRLLLTVFAGVALILAAIGIYGVMSYLMGQRKREMGIRLALGSTPVGVRSMVIRRRILLGTFGLGIGLLAALVVGRLLAHTLRRVSGSDPVSFGATFVVLPSVIFAASAIPAWRASRIDPAITLR